jgi:hypothetical protein
VSEIQLRGHRDDGSLLEETADDLLTNERNFTLRSASGDIVLENHLRETGVKATYISQATQSQLLDCCREKK